MRADAARAAAMHTAATGTLDALRAIATAQCSPRLHATHTMRTHTMLAATRSHNTLHYTCIFLHSAYNKRVMNFLDTANTVHTPCASSRFPDALRASTAFFCTRNLNQERA